MSLQTKPSPNPKAKIIRLNANTSRLSSSVRLSLPQNTRTNYLIPLLKIFSLTSQSCQLAPREVRIIGTTNPFATPFAHFLINFMLPTVSKELFFYTPLSQFPNTPTPLTPQTPPHSTPPASHERPSDVDADQGVSTAGADISIR